MTLPPPRIVPTITDPVRATGRSWHTRELRVIREYYAANGVAACAPLLPDRTPGAIHQAARHLGIRYSGQSHTRRRYTTSEHMDNLIRAAYQSPDLNKGVIRDLAARIQRPGWWIRERGIKLDVAMPNFSDPPWTEPEVQLLQLHAHKHPNTIVRHFRRAGYRRSETAIVVKRKRIDCDTHDPNHYTAGGLAKIMGVNPKTTARWIGAGRLKAKRRGTHRTDAQGGDQWWIHRSEVREFLLAHVSEWDHRKVDKWWLVDILANR